MIKVAVIGVGSISECHLDAYVKNKDAELYAICDITPETLKRQGERYNIPEERCLKSMPFRFAPGTASTLP